MLNPRRQSRNQKLDAEILKHLEKLCRSLPAVSGQPILFEVLPQLSVQKGELFSQACHGKAVYAASFIRTRRIVLDSTLLRRPAFFRAILVHELFHFVWVRLGNPLRASFTHLLSVERDKLVAGELGESSIVSKSRRAGINQQQTPAEWRHYVCESFCDTAAFLLTGTMAGDDARLSKRWIDRRRAWFNQGGLGAWKL